MREVDPCSPIANAAPPGRRNIVLLQSGDLRKPVFCVHAADGDVVPYLQLARELGGAAQTYGITSLDLDLKTLPPVSVRELAEQYCDQVRQIQRRGPIQLVGWSSGGWIAFEIANALQRYGEAIGSVTLLDSAPPKPDPTFDLPPSVLALRLTTDEEQSAMLWWRFLCVCTFIDAEASGIPPGFWTLSDAARGRFVLEHARRQDLFKPRNALLPATDVGDILYMFNFVNLQFEAFHGYEASYFGGKLNLFLSLRCGLPEAQIRRRIDFVESFWRGRITGELKSHHIVGDHAASLSPPAVQDVAKVILE